MKHTTLRARGIIALGALATVLAGCGAATPEDARAASMAKCERQFGRMAGGDTAKGEALCGCMVDRLAEEGMEITDVLSGDREKVMGITRSCAQVNGIPIAG